MHVNGRSLSFLPHLNSLMVKAVLMMALLTLAVLAAMVCFDYSAQRKLLQSELSSRAENVTELLAMQMGGSIKFGNDVAVAEITESVMSAAKPEAKGALVVNAAGQELFATQDVESFAPDVLSHASAAVESRQLSRSEDGLLVAYPVMFGPEDGIAGAVVTVWDDSQIIALLAQNQMMATAVSAVVFILAMALIIAYAWYDVSRPLHGLADAMSAIARREYQIDVPGTRRGDEIGNMARRLDGFRLTLDRARKGQRESAFKGAAFEGSTASMMMVDEDHRIIFVNPACTKLLNSLLPDLEVVWPGVRHDQWMGCNLADVDGFAGLLGTHDSGGDKSVVLRVGARHVRINLSQANDHNGKLIGAVVEWSDQTIAQRDAALLGGIDSTQMRIEFDALGQCSSMNAVAAQRLDIDPVGCTDIALSGLVVAEQPDPGIPTDILAALQEGKSLHGKIDLARADGQRLVIDGGFVCVRADDNRVERCILIGTDVTEAELEVRAARDQQAQVAQEQTDVVAALGKGLQCLSDGDLTLELTEPFPDDYEKLRLDFNDALIGLRNAMATVTQNVDSIRSETTEITTAADDLPRRTERQAATLEETAAALDELTSSVRSAAEGADAASKTSRDAQRSAEQGGDIARQAVVAMDGIKTSSNEISKITSVIDDIAFQTNLLALNAGVEAARAGDAGRGFAVVATEVRALAQRSSEAAREINTLISSSGEQVQRGVELVGRTGTALSAIVSSVADISDRMAEIATSARQQSTGLNEINAAVNELDHVTQQNAAMFEETTAASHALTGEADALAEAVAKFRIGVVPSETAEDTHNPQELPSAGQIPAIEGAMALDLSFDRVKAPTGWEEF